MNGLLYTTKQNKKQQKRKQARERARRALLSFLRSGFLSLSVGASVEFWLRQLIWHCIVCLRRRKKRYAHCWNNFCSSIYFRLVIRSDEKICIICFYSSCSKVVGWPLDSPEHFFLLLYLLCVKLLCCTWYWFIMSIQMLFHLILLSLEFSSNSFLFLPFVILSIVPICISVLFNVIWAFTFIQ